MNHRNPRTGPEGRKNDAHSYLRQDLLFLAAIPGRRVSGNSDSFGSFPGASRAPALINMIGRPVALVQIPCQRGFGPSAAARYLGISYNTLIKITELQQIAAYNFNGRRLYRLEDLDKLLQSLPEWDNPSREKPTLAHSTTERSLNVK
jgi:hypothetical protein